MSHNSSGSISPSPLNRVMVMPFSPRRRNSLTNSRSVTRGLRESPDSRMRRGTASRPATLAGGTRSVGWKPKPANVDMIALISCTSCSSWKMNASCAGIDSPADSSRPSFFCVSSRNATASARVCHHASIPAAMVLKAGIPLSVMRANMVGRAIPRRSSKTRASSRRAVCCDKVLRTSPSMTLSSPPPPGG